MGRPGNAATAFDGSLMGAEATFAERGYNAATIHEICARASVGIGTCRGVHLQLVLGGAVLAAS